MMPATIGEIAALPAHLRNLIDRLIDYEVLCEREACAAIAANYESGWNSAAAIRARGAP